MLTRREMRARLVNLQRRYDAGAHRSDCADLGLGISDLIRDLSAPPTLPEGWHAISSTICRDKDDAHIGVVGDRIQFSYRHYFEETQSIARVIMAEEPIAVVRAALELAEEGKE